MILSNRQLDLLEYVKFAHGDQKRKYTMEPYYTHCITVAEIVSEYDHSNGMIEIALCHDLFEDTTVTEFTLRKCLKELGYTVQEQDFIVIGVTALSDYWTSERFPQLNRGTRKHLEAIRLGKINESYQTIKYADLIHNTKSIIQHDKGLAKKYIPEKREILNLMRMGNLELFIRSYELLLVAENELTI